VYRPYAYQQIDFDTLYRVYWPCVVRFCTTWLSSCPDGTAEEVAQDVFLAAHRALAEQRYRGEGSLSAWLFGIARNLCCKVARDLSRQTTPLVLRRLEGEIARQEYELAHLMCAQTPLAAEQVRELQAQLTLAYDWREREQARLQQRLREATHGASPAPPDTSGVAPDACTVMRHSLQQLAQQDRQAHALLHMHVLKGVTVRELAALQGMSRSAVARRLTRAKATLRMVYQAALLSSRPEFRPRDGQLGKEGSGEDVRVTVRH
jgi:RNA polymerase sigma factor (sigma-70 family)